MMDDARCACGRWLPMLKEIQGRSTDFVVATDGTVMHGLALIYILRDLPGVCGFKIIQHSLDHTQVQLVVDATFDHVHETVAIADGVRRRLGQRVRVDVDLVAEIALEKSGKFRYVVSHVQGNAVLAPATFQGGIELEGQRA